MPTVKWHAWKLQPDRTITALRAPSDCDSCSSQQKIPFYHSFDNP